PPLASCGDNAGMIAEVALDRYRAGASSPLSTDALAHGDLEVPYSRLRASGFGRFRLPVAARSVEPKTKARRVGGSSGWASDGAGAPWPLRAEAFSSGGMRWRDP
ncbi:hypothetical protein, partial [Adlercreutzia sp. DFI.6.23]|uniref:hypothetical protein n=1 Tax=Adlercreutzia sp. DFI.6.23 TaxID=2963705 RepID=UPI00210D465A